MLRFNLGTLLICVSVVAVSLAILESATRDWRRRNAIAREIESYGGSDVLFDDENNVTWITVRDHVRSNKIAQFHRLEHLYCSDSNVTDDDLRHIRTLPRIMCIHLDGTRVTDAGLAHLAGIGKITVLRLNRTRITDAGMDSLATLNIENGIDLSGTKVTLQGVEYLKSRRPDLDVMHRDIGLWIDNESPVAKP